MLTLFSLTLNVEIFTISASEANVCCVFVENKKIQKIQKLQCV